MKLERKYLAYHISRRIEAIRSRYYVMRESRGVGNGNERSFNEIELNRPKLNPRELHESENSVSQPDLLTTLTNRVNSLFLYPFFAAKPASCQFSDTSYRFIFTQMETLHKSKLNDELIFQWLIRQ